MCKLIEWHPPEARRLRGFSKPQEDCDGSKKHQAFSEYTLTILAQGLELDYPDLLRQVEELQSNTEQGGGLVTTPRAKKMAALLLTAIFTAILTIVLFKEFAVNNTDELAADTPRLQDVLIHAGYPHIVFAHDEKGNTLWHKNLDTQLIKVEVA